MHPLEGEAMALTEPHQPDEQSAAISAALDALLGPAPDADDLVVEQSPNPRRPPSTPASKNNRPGSIRGADRSEQRQAECFLHLP